MEAANYTVHDFLRDMGPPFNLSYRPQTTINNMWVFWSQKGGGGGEGVTETLANNNRGNVQEYLKYALCNAEYFGSANILLIQFWAPTTTSCTIGRRCVLTTSNQPFGLHIIERGLCEYRKYCSSLKFNIFQDEEEEDEFVTIIRRVFKSKRAEASTRSHLLHDFACKCGIHRSFFLPLFKPSGWCCSGVLELVHTCKSSFSYHHDAFIAKHIFKEANLRNPYRPELQESTEIEEINKALQVVSTTHQLPLAQIWIPCCTSTAMADADIPGERCDSPYLNCSNKFSSSISQSGDTDIYHAIKEFNQTCVIYNFMKGQGIVGKALLYHKPYFCRDVTQLPEAEYPLSNDARLSGLTGCCAIWLHSTRTKNHDYVLEFFLPRNTISGDPHRYFELLLASVKKQLPDFKISSMGEESCVEVCEISVNDDENEVVLLLSDDEPTMEEGVRKNELNVAIVKQTSEAVKSSKRIFSRAEASEREYRTTDITLSREDLTKHFGKKLDDAAKILNVSRSTMKRALRHHKIDKWPLPKRKKVVRSGNEGIEGTYKGDTSCSDSPPTPATAGIFHKTSNSRQEQDVGNVTIKATHGNKTFRFKLPFLSRKTDLVDKLTTRLSLNEGSFNIQYQDEENEWISIACDEDLEECIGIWKGKSIIKMLVEPITNQAP